MLECRKKAEEVTGQRRQTSGGEVEGLELGKSTQNAWFHVKRGWWAGKTSMGSNGEVLEVGQVTQGTWRDSSYPASFQPEVPQIRHRHEDTMR